MNMAKIMFCKVDRYSDKYRDIFRSSPIYCGDCNGNLIGVKTFNNGKELLLLECRNCHKRIEVNLN